LRDVSRITAMISWRLIRGGFKLPGLWRALTQPALIADDV